MPPVNREKERRNLKKLKEKKKRQCRVVDLSSEYREDVYYLEKIGEGASKNVFNIFRTRSPSNTNKYAITKECVPPQVEKYVALILKQHTTSQQERLKEQKELHEEIKLQKSLKLRGLPVQTIHGEVLKSPDNKYLVFFMKKCGPLFSKSRYSNNEIHEFMEKTMRLIYKFTKNDIIYMDLKPGNTCINDRGSMVMLDFDPRFVKQLVKHDYSNSLKKILFLQFMFVVLDLDLPDLVSNSTINKVKNTLRDYIISNFGSLNKFIVQLIVLHKLLPIITREFDIRTDSVKSKSSSERRTQSRRRHRERQSEVSSEQERVDILPYVTIGRRLELTNTRQPLLPDYFTDFTVSKEEEFIRLIENGIDLDEFEAEEYSPLKFLIYYLDINLRTNVYTQVLSTLTRLLRI